MTLRSLNRCFNLQDEKIGLTQSSGTGEKLVVSSNNRSRRMVVPGYISEVEFQNDKKVVDVDPSQITGRNANWNRYYIRVIKRRSTTHGAIADHDVISRRVREI